jgi:8-oxo-dGTP diphosphatase
MSIGLRAYVATFLFSDAGVLLIRRSADRDFAPGRWTGIGGRVEADELDDIPAAALRELREEAGIRADDVADLRVRRAVARQEDGDVAVLFFCSGRIRSDVSLVESPEGSPQWIAPDRLDEVEMIPNARRSLTEILSDPDGDSISIVSDDA